MVFQKGFPWLISEKVYLTSIQIFQKNDDIKTEQWTIKTWFVLLKVVHLLFIFTRNTSSDFFHEFLPKVSTIRE